MTEYDTVISPCVSICKLDKKSICIGCLRSAREIRDWYKLDNAGKQKILDKIKERNNGPQRTGAGTEASYRDAQRLKYAQGEDGCAGLTCVDGRLVEDDEEV